MKFNLKLTNTSVTPELRAYLEEKLAQVEKLIDPRDEGTRADVELAQVTKHHRHGPFFRAEINLHSGGQDFYASAEAEDLLAALDLVKDEINHQISNRDKKKITLLRRGGRLLKRMLRNLNYWRR